MSDSDFRPKRFLYMPASAAAALAQAPPVPGQLSSFSLDWHYIFFWFSIWRQYTWQSPWTHRAMRTEPFENMLLSCVVSSEVSQIFSNHMKSYHHTISFWGEEPFAMERASQCIEDLANNVMGRYSLLDVSLLLVSIHVPRIISQGLDNLLQILVEVIYGAPGACHVQGLQLALECTLNLDLLVKIWRLSWSQVWIFASNGIFIWSQVWFYFFNTMTLSLNLCFIWCQIKHPAKLHLGRKWVKIGCWTAFGGGSPKVSLSSPKIRFV